MIPPFILFCADFYTLTSVANLIHSIAFHFFSFHTSFRAITISPGYYKSLLEKVVWFGGIVFELSVRVPGFYKSLICV